jgi:hypothetical protein
MVGNNEEKMYIAFLIEELVNEIFQNVRHETIVFL